MTGARQGDADDDVESKANMKPLEPHSDSGEVTQSEKASDNGGQDCAYGGDSLGRPTRLPIIMHETVPTRLR